MGLFNTVRSSTRARAGYLVCLSAAAVAAVVHISAASRCRPCGMLPHSGISLLGMRVPLAALGLAAYAATAMAALAGADAVSLVLCAGLIGVHSALLVFLLRIGWHCYTCFAAAAVIALAMIFAPRPAGFRLGWPAAGYCLGVISANVLLAVST